MKEKLISNWGLKLISVVFAIILWLVVVNVDDPVTTKKFKNIPVNILSENLIAEAGEVYEVLDKSDYVTITVKAKRSVVESLSEGDFKASADFAERIAENSIPIKVEATKRAGDIEEIYLQNNTVKITVEQKAYKDVKVELQVNGKTADGYVVGSASTTPEVVQIAGPVSVISKVERIIVPVDVNGASEDISITAQGKFYEKGDKEVSNSRIEGDIDNINISVHLLHTKSIDLNLTTQGEPVADYWCQDILYEPTTITVAGEPEELEQISTLVIPPEEFDITGAKENIVKEIDVTKYLPGSLLVCNENERVIKVTVVIAELNGKEFRIPASEVGILNTPTGLDTVIDTSRSVMVIVKGNSDALNNLSRDDIKVAVDLKGKEAGTYNLQADVTVPNGYVVMNKPTVSITLQPMENTNHPPVVGLQTSTPANQDVPTPVPQNTPAVVPTPTPTPVPPPQNSADTVSSQIPEEELNEGN